MLKFSEGGVQNAQFCTKFRPSPSRKHFNIFGLTEIDQGIFELCERKEKVSRSVGRSTGYIHTNSRFYMPFVVKCCATAMAPKGNSHIADMLPYIYTFSLSLTVLELRVELCSIGRQTISIRRLVAP